MKMNDVANNWFSASCLLPRNDPLFCNKKNKRTKELKLRYIAPLQHSFRVANQFHCKNTRRRRMSNVTTTLCLRLHQWKTRPTHRKKILYTLALFTAFVSLTTKLVKTQTHQLYYNYSRRRFAESVLNDS